MLRRAVALLVMLAMTLLLSLSTARWLVWVWLVTLAAVIWWCYQPSGKRGQKNGGGASP